MTAKESIPALLVESYKEILIGSGDDLNENIYYTAQIRGFSRQVLKGRLTMSHEVLTFTPYKQAEPIKILLSSIKVADFTSVISKGRFIIRTDKKLAVFHTSEPFTLSSFRASILHPLRNRNTPQNIRAPYIKGPYWKDLFLKALPRVTKVRDEVRLKYILVALTVFITIFIGGLILIVTLFAAP